jgi:pimeloyl-ACP methyl ester carboxylesterase
MFIINIGASYQTDTSKVKLRGKFLKSRNDDMPTMLWFPEVLEPAENFEKWLEKPENEILNNRNVWLLNPRNFGDSDHHDSFDMEEIAHDINRFLEEKKLTMVTVGGHGYGAKIACVFGSFYHDKTTGVVCLEGGPIDHSYHEAWEEVANAIIKCSTIKVDSTSFTDIYKKIDQYVESPKWRSILKQNLTEGKGSAQWKFNMERLAENVKKGGRCDLSKWSTYYGLYPGRAFALFAEYSQWVFLNTNTIPFYRFFPKLENRFPSPSFNFIQTPDNKLNHWLHEYPEEQNYTVHAKISRWLKHTDGVHNLLADRSEVGWFSIEERDSKSLLMPAAEFVPEHVHHNWKYTETYQKSKERRKQIAAAVGEVKRGFSNENLW